ncbi:Holliday junction resolvase RuvX [Helicobacter cappadocius]|uniref:Holliday junction resolvase RuvX n=1 Tax=Helicobacter cappadocius TaxID=3063998 RepID=A0AA90PPH5_9HELI|nr:MULTISPECIES: Holliday junction resolvase RuvX [unclassified Helicobacter]MDO7252389.1 Holliday junction resolvase RuvX [Helicobacter sp. faydin-H75]MDP2538256.1 Holliday junction resolvase RuvX [Helicobacter sp. faydin-H76]
MIACCDVGLKKIGLAICLNNIVLPLDPILRKNRNQASLELRDFLTKKGIKTLVVGLPSGGTPGYEDTRSRIKHFITLVEFAGEIVFVNEDYSSLEAFEEISHMRRKSKIQAQKNGKLDSIAACKILQRFLELPKE